MALIAIHVFTKQRAISLTSQPRQGLLHGATFDDETLAASPREKGTFREF